MSTPNQNNELKGSTDLEKLVGNPIQENEAGQIEGGFAEAAIQVDKEKDPITVNVYMCH